MTRRRLGEWVAYVALAMGCGSSVTSTDAGALDVAREGDGGALDSRVIDAAEAGRELDGAVPLPDADEPTDDAGEPTDDAGEPTIDRSDVAADAAPIADVPGASCESATLVGDGVVLTAQAFGAPSSVPICDGSGARSYATRWYRAIVPANAVLEVNATGGDPGNTFMSLFSACGASTCLAYANGGRTLGPLVFHNAAGAPRTVFVALANGGRNPMPATVAFRIRGAAVNATCATATPLAAGVTLGAQDLGLSAENARGCFGGDDPGVPALYYSITVPPRTALLAHAAATSAATSTIYSFVRPPCDEGGCLATAFNVNDPRGGITGQFNNGSDLPRAVSVAVATTPRDARPVVDVTATLRALPPNGRCGEALPLASGVAARIEHPEDATDATPRCPGATDVPPRALFYAIVVPPGQTLSASVATPAGGVSYGFVRLFAGCGGVCLGASSPEVGTPRVVYTNASAAAQSLIVATGQTRNDLAMLLDLRATVRPPAANVACGGAIALSPGATLAGVDLLEARDPDPCAGAGGGGGGPVLYYSVLVRAGGRLTVEASVTTAAPYGPGLSLIGGCDGTCLARAGSGNPTTTLTYINGGAARAFVVAVGAAAYPGDPTALVSLSARVE